MNPQEIILRLLRNISQDTKRHEIIEMTEVAKDVWEYKTED